MLSVCAQRPERRALDNVVFFDEIDPDEIPGLYSPCHVGLVALDPRHKTHNIPGKFLTYIPRPACPCWQASTQVTIWLV